MKIAVYHSNSDIRIEERAKPIIGPREILVKVKKSGICGTDVMEWYRSKKGPRVLGHEITGAICEKGEEVKNVAVGDRVFVSHHVPCNNCKYCANGDHTACEILHTGNFDPGGFSEYVRVPEINVKFGTYVLPDTISFEEGTMIEPLACVIRGQRVIGLTKKNRVLIIGCGITGLLHVKLAKFLGCYVVASDINQYRLNKAKEYSVDECYFSDAEILSELEKFDTIIVCAGVKSAVRQAFDFLDKKGRILLFAIPKENIILPNVDFWRNEYSLISSYGAAPDDLKESLYFIDSGKIKVSDMITTKLCLEEIQKGFELVANGRENLKVIIYF